MRFPTRSLAAATAVVATALLVAPAAAHVEPEVTTVPAGSEATVAFEVEHGCDGSPTVALELQVPEGVADARPVEKAGWTGEVADRVVSYRGGPLADDRPDTFEVRFTAPDEVGAVLRFPMVQTCEAGQIDWIQTGAEDTRPAPSVEVGPADPNAPAATTTTTPAAEATTTTPATTGQPATSVAPDPTTGPSGGAGTTDVDRPVDEGDDSGSAAPWLLGGVAALLAIGVAAVAYARRGRGGAAGGRTGHGGGSARP